ncbi:MAG: aminopeptidase P family N-terminal domain-containing protein, partial [Chloroflexi bacterium]|nr:aminopeptidase P family N-terminal domain-containing protein [Chloroflexota bacterium]
MDLPVRASGLPTPDDLRRWDAADRDARPRRVAQLRAALAEAGIDAWFGVLREDIRYLTGFVLAEGEEHVAGDSGRTLVGADEVVVLADSRYRVQAHEQAVDCRIEDTLPDLPGRWPELLASIRPIGGGRQVRRVALDAASVSHATWAALVAAAPEVELVEAGP